MSRPTPLIGILGGMGPMATADFMAQLTSLTPAARDQDHHRCVISMDPQLPDRSAAILGRGPSPLPGLIDRLSMLDRCGVDAIAMPCNTAHHWMDDLRRATRTPILSIVDAVAMDLQRRGIDRGDIGILGTLGTVRSAIYARGWAATGYRTVDFDEGEVAVFVEPVIRALKAGRLEEAKPMMRCAVASLESRGVSAVVLGCTELPLAMNSQVSSAGTPLIDSTKALAAACIAWAEAFDATLVQSAQPLKSAA